ncbi:MAG: PAS-domain containing protein, partial [SAR324 cluster bacterium]|nr:PAS-domain containing protein [SAR324 cluster bacterium]
MNDAHKTKAQLMAELETLRGRLAADEGAPDKAKSPGGESAQGGAGGGEPHANLDSVPIGIRKVDTKGKIVFGNSAYHKLMGYAGDELIGKHIWDFALHEEQRKFIRRNLKRLVKSQTPPMPYFGTEQTKDGGTIDVRVEWDYWRDDHGQLKGFVATIADITELNRARADAKVKDELLDIIMENIPLGLTVVDRNLNIVSHNSHHLEMYGLPERFWGDGVSLAEVFRYNAERGEYGPGDVEEQVKERVDLAKQFLPHQFERERPDGSWLEITGRPLPGGGFISITSEVTERKRAEQELRESAKNLAEAQQLAHLGSWERDLATGAVKWSEETYCIHGVDSEQFNPSYDAFMQLVHPDDREKIHKATQSALKNAVPLDVEYRVVHPGGTERIIHEQADFSRDADGKPLRIHGTAHDITERK